ncbi:MAG: rane-associated lipoprotein involved in thiamine biosynthesis [Planctomycetaceae bacterium]|nr:rane-associated lipoprotein involved in thiamine biosynthesis [Planctomycetaceae bacterium]
MLTMTAMLWLGFLFGLTTANLPEPTLTRYEFSQRLMGISFDISVYASDETVANEAAEAAYRRIRELNAIFSDYEPDSELNRLCKTAGTGRAIPVSRELWEIILASVALSEKSEGEFDITVGPLIRLWRKARRAKQLPDVEQIAAARSLVGYKLIKVDHQARTVELTKAGMQLDLGGIAVGYACDDVLKIFQQRKLTRVMIDGSGDILVGEPPPDQAGWIIGIAPATPDGPPSRQLSLKNAAVSTSGDVFQHIEINGVRYSHIVDPKTGLGITDRSTVVVVAKTCLAADAWSTTVSVLGPERGIKGLLESHPEAAALIIRTTAKQPLPETVESPGLQKYLAKGVSDK